MACRGFLSVIGAFFTTTAIGLMYILGIISILGINTPIVIASEYDFQGTKSDLVLDMCKKLKAKRYIYRAGEWNLRNFSLRNGLRLIFLAFQSGKNASEKDPT